MAKPTATLTQALQARRAVIVPGAANMRFGLPDPGPTTTAEIAQTSDPPLIVDMDGGFGNPLNAVRGIGMPERAGAATLQIADQVFPGKHDHSNGKAVIPAPEMIDKINAAADTRRDGDPQIIVRSDARAIEGLSAAIDRALPAPQIATIVPHGRTPDPGRVALGILKQDGSLARGAVCAKGDRRGIMARVFGGTGAS